MNRHHENRIFSDYNKVAVFDENFNIVWCDDDRLFRRIAVSHERLENKFITTNVGETVVHFFLYHGRYHRAFINRLPNGGFICKIAKEITDEELKNDELFEYLDEVCHNSLNIFSMADMLEDYANNTRYNCDSFHENVSIQKKTSLSIYNYCQNIIRAFDNKENCYNIPLQKYLIRTLDIIQFATRRFSRRITLFADPVFPVTNINYSKFELALYNIIKLALIYSTGNDDITVYIRRSSANNIEVETNFRLNTDYRLMNCKLEMHVIKHIFRKLNGHFEFTEENKTLYARGTFTSGYSLNEGDISPGMDIEFIGNSELFEKKESNERYIMIYSRIPAKNNMLASEVAELTDVDDKEIRFAEMFFGDIEVYN